MTDLNCRESKQEVSVHWIMVVVTGVSMANRSVNGGMVLAKVSCFEEPSSSLGAMDSGYPQVSHLDGSDSYAIILRCVVPQSSKRCLNHPKSTGEVGNVDRASQRLVTPVQSSISDRRKCTCSSTHAEASRDPIERILEAPALEGAPIPDHSKS